ncbi:calcyphosin-like protein isoform X2 [Ruditapes philippinarum]|uniref:calcyphosin-like protein isoform X2 n=1 Tax=Ruditapes philippinarum TaxID=129788 RepID=UPI00295A8D8F|nr:calcyphosin-like protein isoform X2 [Ruditapes philippinarum]
MEYTAINKLLEQIRNCCLLQNVSGIKRLSVIFRMMDTDYNKRISFQEFCKGLNIFGIALVQHDAQILFDAFDKNKDNQIDCMELVSKLRPPMTKGRIEVINQAFDLLDANKDGILNIDDLKVVYSTNAKRHPKFVSGEWTEEQVLRNFLDSIDTPGNPDGKVTREEFMNYYAGVSSTVDDDSYFDLMMRACYGMPNKGSCK